MTGDKETDYNFEGLTPIQEYLILYQGWRVGQRFPDGDAWVQPTEDEIRPLIERGLMQEVETQYGLVTVKEYTCGIDVHLAYCMWCDDGK